MSCEPWYSELRDRDRVGIHVASLAGMTNKAMKKKLLLSAQTIRTLAGRELHAVRGGGHQSSKCEEQVRGQSRGNDCVVNR